MIRTTLLWLFVSGIAVYAWRDWYKALCGIILMMAVIQHPDMPQTLGGIQGLSPWNIGLGSTMLAWWSARQRERLDWDMPWPAAILLVLYLLTALISFLRMIGDRAMLEETLVYLTSEHLINVFKWVVPGLLLFDGCRDRRRFTIATYTILAVYVLLAVQVIRWVPISDAMSGQELAGRSHKLIENEIGYHRVNMSMMLAGASWAVLVGAVLVQRWSLRLLLAGTSLAVLLGQSLTAGRTGYVTWAAVGLILCLVRWKKYVLLAPLMVAMVLTLVPGATERMLQGFTEETIDTNSRLEAAPRQIEMDGSIQPDLYTVTSGRIIAWPLVIEKIFEKPLVGHGRLAMKRTGLTDFLMQEYGEGFSHPHNAYLELLLDAGLVGFLCVIPFYLGVLWYCFTLLRDARSPIFAAAGGIAAALTLALLVAASGSQTFYPREGSVGMWCAIGLMLRVAVERQKALAPVGELSSRRRSSGTSTGFNQARRLVRSDDPVGSRSAARVVVSVRPRAWPSAPAHGSVVSCRNVESADVDALPWSTGV